jgi:hypothetical protein
MELCHNELEINCVLYSFCLIWEARELHRVLIHSYCRVWIIDLEHSISGSSSLLNARYQSFVMNSSLMLPPTGYWGACSYTPCHSNLPSKVREDNPSLALQHDTPTPLARALPTGLLHKPLLRYR